MKRRREGKKRTKKIFGGRRGREVKDEENVGRTRRERKKKKKGSVTSRPLRKL